MSEAEQFLERKLLFDLEEGRRDLREKCTDYFNSHKQCEVQSISGRECKLLHNHSGKHDSDYLFTYFCSCGKTQTAGKGIFDVSENFRFKSCCKNNFVLKSEDYTLLELPANLILKAQKALVYPHFLSDLNVLTQGKNKNLYFGFEYECSLGHRFFFNDEEHRLTVTCECNNGEAQLQRVYIYENVASKFRFVVTIKNQDIYFESEECELCRLVGDSLYVFCLPYIPFEKAKTMTLFINKE
jgi:hypothetical protein